MKRQVLFLFILMVQLGCKDANTPPTSIPTPKPISYSVIKSELTEEQYFDKVLGALVGSAIGDAMGASTEMWHRDAIQLRYGYITDLTPAIRVQSPEGTWENNLPRGSTTDDTRWKYLVNEYIKQGNLSADNFIQFIIKYYQNETLALGDDRILEDTDFLDDTIEKVNWMKEWARVATAYSKGSDAYGKALNRFYGGEMSCAGQLYSAMFGLIAQTPEEAYLLAYDHTLFDIGYAKDISSLVAAMTHVALNTQSIDSIISSSIFIDPLGYQDSRLVERISYNIADASINAVLEQKKRAMQDSSYAVSNSIPVPKGFPRDEAAWALETNIFDYLEEDERAIPFHAGEIWQIVISALKFSEGDFDKCMQFIVNYGRDNDTAAAVAGMILGAKDGFSQLPENLRGTVVQTNKEVLGIDLVMMAEDLTALKFPKSE